MKKPMIVMSREALEKEILRQKKVTKDILDLVVCEWVQCTRKGKYFRCLTEAYTECPNAISYQEQKENFY